MSELSANELLRLNLNEQWQRIHGPMLDGLALEFADWQFDTNKLEGIDKEYLPQLQLVLFLQHRIAETLEEIANRQQQFEAFRHAYQSAAKSDEALSHLIAIVQTLNYRKKAIETIRKGKAQWLDQSAVYDRHIQVIAALEQDITVMLQRLSDLVAFFLGYVDSDSLGKIWQSLSLHSNLLAPLNYHANVHVRIAAFACLGQSLKVLRSLCDVVKHRVPGNIVQYVFRTCLDENHNTWLRCEAITLVFQIDSVQFLKVLDQIFVAQPKSDPFLRGRVVVLLCQFGLDNEAIDRAIQHIFSDPSDYVRQCFARHCLAMGDDKALRQLHRLVDSDNCGKVRAQAYLSLQELIGGPCHELALALQLRCLRQEADTFALRTLMHTMPGCVIRLETQQYEQYVQALDYLHMYHQVLQVRRWAGSTREHLWFIAHQDILAKETREKIAQLPFGKQCRIDIPPGVNDKDLYRYIAHLGRQRFGFDIVSGGKKLKLRAGFKFGFRFWRFWHEFTHTATDKRQDHNHLKGRLYCGLVQTGTERMAELSITKVPGEPLYIPEESSAREYLPLLDQVLSSLDQGWPTLPVKIYSAQGITCILPPKNLFRRLYARMQIQFKFARLAALRNWKSSDTGPANQYIEALSQLGFHIWVEGYGTNTSTLSPENPPLEPSVQRFFGVAPLPFALPSVTDMQNYFYSVYQNNLGQLIVFSCAATVSFLAGHIAKLMQLKHYRKKIPLVIGGWGTRGKSGTERLKAALFNSLGLSVMSKTTGCEAMFLYGPANRPMKEMFLFRPYDKASIWEQVFITCLAGKFKADVLLWECMGLTPRYIDIIQNQWMRDDLATITNCYPDHEDLQGPAGIEIPIVMQRFVPRSSHLLTSEESMLPLLEDAARQKHSDITKVSWLEAGLLTDDVISRFPYEEHPNNIALVVKLAKALDIPEDFALREIADNVVADLGVLKIYPTAMIRGRKLCFINGMSANERLGAMGNWTRTGLADYTLQDNPDTWLGIVVNNRADRIARSKVFAAMLVNDMQADCYFFIGNNLSGLQSYIDDAWEAFCQGYEVNADNFILLASRFRLVVSWPQVLGRLKGCLNDVAEQIVTWPQEHDSAWVMPDIDGFDCAAVTERYQTDCRILAEFCDMQAQLAQGRADGKQALEWILEQFKRQWVVVEDYYSSGNQTVNILVQNTPPGMAAKIIGVQNIKGTGLDFIYRWQAWDMVYRHCQTLCHDNDDSNIEVASKALSSWEEFGLLDSELVRQSLAFAKARARTQKELLQAEFRLIEQRLETQMAVIEQSLSDDKQQSKGVSFLLGALEAFLDAGDAVKRRKLADRIYQDLLDGLISYDKASVELAKLTKAQKGGWLEKRIKAKFEQ